MIMNDQENIESKMDEPFSIRIEEPVYTTKNRVYIWFKRIFNIDDIPNQKHHYPVFIIIMCILHICIYLLTYTNIKWNGEKLDDLLYNLFRFYVPCMRPTSQNIRVRIVPCETPLKDVTCRYDDVLKNICFSFMYPHQLWRFLTVNLLHLNLFHLLSNLFYQCFYGIPLERKYGSLRIIIIYWLSNLGAGLSFMLLHREEPAVGASGALYGLLLFFVMDRLHAMRINSDRRLFILWQLILIMLLPFIIVNFLLFLVGLFGGHSAHMGGAVIGFLCSICIFGCPWPSNIEHYVSQTVCRKIAFVLLILYYAITLIIFFLIDAPVVSSIFYRF